MIPKAAKAEVYQKARFGQSSSSSHANLVCTRLLPTETSIYIRWEENSLIAVFNCFTFYIRGYL